MSCKLLLIACAGACVAALGATAIAQGTTDVYPARRVVVGLAPGGATDIQTRLIAQKMSENLGRPFVVESRTGAGGTVAYAFVAKSPADGYTVLGVASGYSITPALFRRLSYDPIKDFAMAVSPLAVRRSSSRGTYLVTQIERWRKVVAETGMRIE